MNPLTEKLILLLASAVAVPVGGALAAKLCGGIIYGTEWFQKLAVPWIKAHIGVKAAAAVDAGIATAQGMACVLVNSAEATAVADFKSAGNWNKETQAKVFADVLGDLHNHVTAAAPQLEAQLGSGLKDLLGDMVEHEVAKISAKGLPVPKPLDAAPAAGASSDPTKPAPAPAAT